MAAPKLSVIVPVLADQDRLTDILDQISPSDRMELIVVSGDPPGHSPASSVAGRSDICLLHTAPGRARQMNAGAAAASGEWLLFLHADSRLPRGWLDALDTAFDAAHGGWFRFALDDPAWQARVIERGVALRVRLFGLPYGDQGFFVRRDLFTSLGGYRDIPLMEDVDFARRLRARGRVVELPLALATSSRRWRRDGWWRRSMRNVMLVMLYFAGVSPHLLARWYAR